MPKNFSDFRFRFGALPKIAFMDESSGEVSLGSVVSVDKNNIFPCLVMYYSVKLETSRSVILPL